MTDVTCTHCDYRWEYGGDLQYATCPSCRSKTAVDRGDGSSEVPAEN